MCLGGGATGAARGGGPPCGTGVVGVPQTEWGGDCRLRRRATVRDQGGGCAAERGVSAASRRGSLRGDRCGGCVGRGVVGVACGGGLLWGDWCGGCAGGDEVGVVWWRWIAVWWVSLAAMDCCGGWCGGAVGVVWWWIAVWRPSRWATEVSGDECRLRRRIAVWNVWLSGEKAAMKCRLAAADCCAEIGGGVLEMNRVRRGGGGSLRGDRWCPAVDRCARTVVVGVLEEFGDGCRLPWRIAVW